MLSDYHHSWVEVQCFGDMPFLASESMSYKTTSTDTNIHTSSHDSSILVIGPRSTINTTLTP